MSEVLNQVGLGKLLEQEQGLDIWLGDGGRPLSGGEQRRLGLARILLNDAPILLLDEPTEGLDRETERQILRLILAHAENKTLIMVTHRLTAIEQFDELCVIDEAKLIEKGIYAELLQLEKGFGRKQPKSEFLCAENKLGRFPPKLILPYFTHAPLIV